jgi:hypothetical protein
MHENTSFDVSNMDIELLFLVDFGFEGEKNGGILVNLYETGVS